jgi:hypothetical protein
MVQVDHDAFGGAGLAASHDDLDTVDCDLKDQSPHCSASRRRD